jgi:signal transduction histidine kinase
VGTAEEREKRAIEVLVRFGELLANAAGAQAVMQELANSAVSDLAAKAAVIVAIGEDGVAHVGAKAGLHGDCTGFPGDADIDASLADDLKARCPEIAEDQVVPLMLASGGDLFGMALLVFPKEADLDGHRMQLARGIAALAASGLSQAARYAQLARSYADLRASREVLERGQKLRSLGEMAAGVSHDLKNILNPLSLHLQFIQRGLPADATDARESVVEMRGVLQRGLQTIERLREFSRQAPSGKAEIADPDGLVREALAITKARLHSSQHDRHYRLVEELGAARKIRVQTAEAVAAVVNLIVNAVDAMPTGGTITVATGERDSETFIRIADDGPGMSPEVEARVFEPFFTTKGQEGTGLGLAMVYAFVQRSHGRVTLETAPGKGAAFTLWFPSVDP